MFGPVIGAELLRAARRGRAHVLTWLFAGWLSLQSFYLCAEFLDPGPGRRPPVDAAAFARSFVDTVLTQHLLLIALVTPAFAAGAITDEKVRGTLQNLLAARLTPADIVLGKLGARVVQVGVLGLVPLPLVAAVGPYAGVTVEFLVIWLVVTTLLVAGISAVSILASVWSKQTRNAVLLAYALLGGLWAVRWFAFNVPFVSPAWLEAFNPLRPLLPALDHDDPAEAFRRLGMFAAAWGGLGLVGAALAVWQLRPAYLRQLDARPRRFARARLATRPAPGEDALVWKELYIGRRKSLGRVVLLAAAAMAIATAEETGLVSSMFFSGTLAVGWWALVVPTVVAVRASGSVSGERERQTWDALLMSPLTEREILCGKLNGILAGAWLYLVFVGLSVVVAMPLFHQEAGAVPMIMILALMPVVTMAAYFIGAVGLYCSATSKSSWRSLAATLGIGYVGGMILLGLGGGLGGAAGSCCGGLLFTMFSNVGGIILGGVFWFVGVGYMYWLAARVFLNEAVRQIALQDRTRPKHLLGLGTAEGPIDPVDGQRL